MKIKYLAHASFLIRSANGVKIITDPYYTGQGLNYSPITETADIVTISHGHSDHNNVGSVKGNPQVLKEAGSNSIRGIDIKSIPVYHDEDRGSKRGNNLIFCFKIDDLNVCHLGDLGHPLEQQQLSAVGKVDIIMIPVGGFFTIDAKEASAVALSLGARAILPMHYKTAKADYPIKPIDEFLKTINHIRRINSSEIELNKDILSSEAEIIVLQPALL